MDDLPDIEADRERLADQEISEHTVHGASAEDAEDLTTVAAELFRRHIAESISAAHTFRNEEVSTMGDELIAALPTLAGRGRKRNMSRKLPDRRRNASLRCRFTALDNPNIHSTGHIDLANLRARGLGRREDTVCQLSLTTSYQNLKEKAYELFPILLDVQIDVMIGKRGAKLQPLEHIITLNDIKSTIPRGGYARLWVRPLQQLIHTHTVMGTPTVLARPQMSIRTDVSSNIGSVANETEQDQSIAVPEQQIVYPTDVSSNIGSVANETEQDQPITVPQQQIVYPTDVLSNIGSAANEIEQDQSTTVPQQQIVYPTDVLSNIGSAANETEQDQSTTVPQQQIVYPTVVLSNIGSVANETEQDQSTTVPQQQIVYPTDVLSNIGSVANETEQDQSTTVSQQQIVYPTDVLSNIGSAANEIEQEQSITGMIVKMRERIEGEQIGILVTRNAIMQDLLDNYKTLDVTRPLKVVFVGEDGEDFGGMTEDTFSQFFEEVFSHYFKGNNVCVPAVPPNRRAEARLVFTTIGKILEHMVCLTGKFPLRLSRVVILAIGNKEEEPDKELLLRDYLRFLPEPTALLINRCMHSRTWTEADRRELTLFFSTNGLSCLPNPSSLSDRVKDLAQVQLLDLGQTFISMIRNGTSPFALKELYEHLTSENIEELFAAYEPTAEGVASLYISFMEEMDMTQLEQSIVYFLATFVRDISMEDLLLYLRWVTGSPAMPHYLKVTFNGLTGIVRRPLAHTCSNLVELSTDYCSYEEFKKELLAVLHDPEAWSWSMP